MNVDRILGRAWRAATRGDGVEALERLLEAWRITRHPAIADALDAVAARFQRARRTRDSDDNYRTFLQADALQLGELLDGSLVSQEVALRQVESLLQRPADPRSARAVVEDLELVRGRTPSQLVQRAAASLLMVVADVRLLARVRALRTRYAGDWADEALAPAEQHLAALEPPALTLAATEILEALVAGAPPPASDHDGASESTLVTAVYSALDDDAPRLVYADWLSDRNDPRGELIVLQCERTRSGTPPSQREEDLIARHSRAWLGPLEPYVARAGAHFERGFLDRVRMRRVLPDALLDDPRWTTVTAIDFGRTTVVADLMHVQLVNPGNLPSLTWLGVRDAREPNDADAITDTPVGARLRVLELGLFGRAQEELPSLDGFVAWLRTRAPARLERLALVGDNSTVTLTRTASGDVEVHARIGARELRRQPLLDTLRRQLGDRFTIDVDKPVPPR